MIKGSQSGWLCACSRSCVCDSPLQGHSLFTILAATCRSCTEASCTHWTRQRNAQVMLCHCRALPLLVISLCPQGGIFDAVDYCLFSSQTSFLGLFCRSVLRHWKVLTQVALITLHFILKGGRGLSTLLWSRSLWPSSLLKESLASRELLYVLLIIKESDCL